MVNVISNLPIKGRDKQRGVSLIEALVAVLIIALGILGVAGLQMKSMRGLQSSDFNSSAALLVNDMGERMRSNSAQASQYVHNKEPTGNARDCSAKNCNATQYAKYDVDEWWDLLESQLPSGQGRVLNDGNNTYTIRVYWDDDRNGSSATVNCPPKSTDDMDCYSIQVAF